MGRGVGGICAGGAGAVDALPRDRDHSPYLPSAALEGEKEEVAR